jgi:hypothetical protein
MKFTSVIRETLRPLTAGVCLFVVVFNSSTAADAPATKVAMPYVVLTGPKSQVKERGCFRLTSAGQWVALWQRHIGQKPADEYDEFHNPAAVPRVNFGDCMVIAVFQGEGANSAGLNSFSVQEDRERIVFRFEDKGYQTVNQFDDVTVYEFFVLPQSEKTLIVEENLQTLIGKPPIWKERARFEALQPGQKK